MYDFDILYTSSRLADLTNFVSDTVVTRMTPHAHLVVDDRRSFAYYDRCSLAEHLSSMSNCRVASIKVTGKSVKRDTICDMV